MRVLLLQLEFSTWKTARPWSYGASFAFSDGLMANGVECVTVPIMPDRPSSSPSSWLYHARRFLAGQRFDQVWIWLVHAPPDPHVLEWITTLAPVRVGFFMESLRYEEEDYRWAPELRSRQVKFQHQLQFLTHALLVDERDVEELTKHGGMPALWCPGLVPERFIAQPSQPPRYGRAVFHGSVYGARGHWIDHPILQSRMVFAKVPAQYTPTHQSFDQFQEATQQRLLQRPPVSMADLGQYVREWKRIREREFRQWLEGLTDWSAIVNLPGLTRCFGGRVFEAMAVGRPIISWRIPDRTKTNALFEDGKEILLFSPDDPGSLASQIDRVLNDRSFAQSVALAGQRKVLAHHTAEQRAKGILQWLASGVEPDHGIPGPRPSAVSGLVSVTDQSSRAKRALGPAVRSAFSTTVFMVTVDDPLVPVCLEMLRTQERPGIKVEMFKRVEHDTKSTPVGQAGMFSAIPTPPAVAVETAGLIPFEQIHEGALPMKSPGESNGMKESAGYDADTNEFYTNLFVKNSHWSTPHPNPDEAARWAKIAAFLECILRVARKDDPARRLRMIEVGCGRGWLTNLASSLYGTCEGIEPVAGVIDHARRLFPHLRFEAGTAETVLDRPDFVPYDVVLCSEVIEHVPRSQKAAFVRSLRQLLKPGGHLVMTTPRGELWEQWKKMAMPNQPVEEWLTERELESLLAGEELRCVGLDRVYLEMPSLRFIPAPTPAELRAHNFVPIYQVWACEWSGGRLATSSFSRTPMVSVIVPTCNRPDRLRVALASIEAQTYRDFEVVVVNDGTIDIESVITEFNRDGRITYIRHDHNRGLAAARNTGIRAAKGKYIAYLDDDDRYLPHHLETLVTLLKGSEFKVVYTDAWRVHEKNDKGLYVEAGRDLPYSHDYNPADLLVSNYFPVLCVMHERACIDEVGCFDESLFAHEDWDLWIRMATKFPFKHLKHTTAEFTWREDGSSMTSGTRDTYVRTTEIIYRKYRPYAERVRGVLEAQQQKIARLTATHAVQTFDCSIIIPVWNKVELTKQCLIALADVTVDIAYEVIVVDNGSTDGTQEFLSTLAGDVQVIRNQDNLGFAKACNQGARAARGKYLVFLNNDTIPQEGWLDAMVAEVEAHPEVGIVGSRLLYADGTIQHAGVIFDRQDLLPYHIYQRFPADHPAVNRRRELQAVTGACLLIRAVMFEELGGFDEEYLNGFEDVDLCLKAREKGQAVVYQPRSVVYHLESQTPGRKTHDHINAARLCHRWEHRWWRGDEDLYYYEDNYKVVSTQTMSKQTRALRVLVDDEDRAAWGHMAAAQAAALKQDWDCVRRELASVQDWPLDAGVLLWAGTVCEKLGETVLQRAYLEKALGLGEVPPVRCMLARAELQGGNVAKARQHVERLLVEHPAHAEGLLLKGVLCMQQERYRDAEAAFSSALEHGGNRKQCVMGRGMARMGHDRADLAWQDFSSMLAESPDNAEAIHWLLRAGTAQNRWGELSRQLRTYVSRNPGDLAVRFALAGVLVRADRVDEALREYESLRALDPSYDGLAELGRVLAEKENTLAADTGRA